MSAPVFHSDFHNLDLIHNASYATLCRLVLGHFFSRFGNPGPPFFGLLPA